MRMCIWPTRSRRSRIRSTTSTRLVLVLRHFRAHDFLDRRVAESARGEVRVDLPLALRRCERRPARERPRQSPLRLLDIGIRRALYEDDLDDLARHTLPEQLALQRTVAARLEALALLDPPAREGFVIHVPLCAQAVDGLIDDYLVESLRAQVTVDLRHRVRPPGEISNGGLIWVAAWGRCRVSPLHRPGSQRGAPRRRNARAPSPRSPRRRSRCREEIASRPRGPGRCASCRS